MRIMIRYLFLFFETKKCIPSNFKPLIKYIREFYFSVMPDVALEEHQEVQSQAMTELFL